MLAAEFDPHSLSAEWVSCNAAIGRAGFTPFLGLSAAAQGT